MTPQEFADICGAHGAPLDAWQREAFERFANALASWNERINLISRRDIAQVWEKHMLHSASLLWHATVPHGARVVDIGSGGGFPGIPLKLCRPDLDVVLLDSVQKKVTAVQSIIEEIRAGDDRWSGLSAACGRAEDLSQLPVFHRTFTVAVARAVAPLRDVIAWTRDLLAPRGQLLALKGGALDDEIAAARAAFRALAITVVPLRVPEAPSFERDAKQLVIVQW